MQIVFLHIDNEGGSFCNVQAERLLRVHRESPAVVAAITKTHTLIFLATVTRPARTGEKDLSTGTSFFI